ncbi:dienelactone hydrolase family protein [Nostoc ellipsosporum NOK]|nr:dienelactone hydrolase family protein [Nostoc ellipsosporum NOK]
MDQRIIDLYDEYTHRPLTRPEFLRRLAMLAGGMTAALAILPNIEVNATNARITSDSGLFTERIRYKGVNGETEAYVARPKEEKQYAAVVIIHENRGLNAHIEDVARRAAQAGYLAIAPNALSVLGGTPADEDQARQLFQQLKQEESIENFMLAFPYLKTRKDYNGKAGCVGFCWGGAMANTLAVRQAQDLLAAVAFYGRQPATADVAKIKAAVQLHYAGLDTRVNEGMETYEKALKENKIRYEQYVYPDVNHAFHNDTAPTRYDAAAAKLAWSRTLAFFERYLA